MPLIKSPRNNFGSGNFGSGNSKLRAIVTTAAAALIGTLVGGVSVLGVVMAVTQPPNHEIQSDMRAGGESALLTAPPPEQAATTPSQQTAPVAPAQSVPPIQGPRTIWPDGLSARSNHDSETATETPVPQQASPPANDRAALNQNDESGVGREPTVANSEAVTPRDAPPNPISPNTAPAKKRAVVSPAVQSVERTVDEVPAGDASIGKARGDMRKSQPQLARQQRRSPDTANQSSDDQAAASPPQRRVVIQPSPDQTANDDRGHWGGGLFDFFGQNHSDSDHWNQDHWNNGWQGSHDWHD
jgi:hypothetical protein